ncbi:hypothetical protein [Streptomyces halobius]|uniref:Uncharacterized protein n=1 Tax=Streptomyces halobius TaxID=2879846 RepID=A0ABY4M7G5_9ACTN|nr:hypothetical protein [Streptomyces halobius]UQA93660.1 hypothetical protein K9S39_18970 [Streptomyces halobius]
MSKNTPAPKGFIVTTPIAPTVPASALQDGDAFALPEAPDNHLIAQGIKPHPDLTSRLIISARGIPAPFTIHSDEPLQPLRMLRTFELTCQLCNRTVSQDLDLVTHGTPQTWVCNLCS